MYFQIPQTANLEAFVKFWADAYDYANEPLYAKNIGQPLNEDGILELFLWKNGRKLSKPKEKSVREHYISQIKELEKTPKDIEPQEWFKKFGGGGVIWNIFFLHIWSQKFPIFDQHVYRAMKFIKTGKACEIPLKGDQKIKIYLGEYLLFYNQLAKELKHSHSRDLDRALWKFGQFLKWLEPPSEDEADE